MALMSERNNQTCDCGEPLQAVMSASFKVDVWKHNYIEEIDKNIRFRSMRHAREVARAKGVGVDTTPINKVNFDAIRRQEERERRRPVSVDLGRR